MIIISITKTYPMQISISNINIQQTIKTNYLIISYIDIFALIPSNDSSNYLLLFYCIFCSGTYVISALQIVYSFIIPA